MSKYFPHSARLTAHIRTYSQTYLRVILIHVYFILKVWLIDIYSLWLYLKSMKAY